MSGGRDSCRRVVFLQSMVRPVLGYSAVQMLRGPQTFEMMLQSTFRNLHRSIFRLKKMRAVWRKQSRRLVL